MRKSDPLRKTIFALALMLQVAAITFHTRGAAGDVDLTFDAGSGVNGTVQSTLLQPDGKLIIGGQIHL